MSTAVKVVLHNSESDELDLGMFNQGVVIDSGRIIDVASGEEIAYSIPNHRWFSANPTTESKMAAGYKHAFIQQVAQHTGGFHVLGQMRDAK